LRVLFPFGVGKCAVKNAGRGKNLAGRLKRASFYASEKELLQLSKKRRSKDRGKKAVEGSKLWFLQDELVEKRPKKVGWTPGGGA